MMSSMVEIHGVVRCAVVVFEPLLSSHGGRSEGECED